VRHGGIGHLSDRFDGSKTAARDSAGPFLGPGRARASALGPPQKRTPFTVFPGYPVWLRLDPDRRMSPVWLRVILLDPEIFLSSL